MASGEAIKVSFVNSVFHRHDAVSNVIRDQIRALGGTKGGTYDLAVFAQDASQTDPRLTLVRSPVELLHQPHFRRSRLVVFHYAVENPLFDAIFAVLPQQRTLAYFHNVTPARLYAEAERQVLATRSERQIDNLFFADRVLCNSAFTLGELAARGLAHERLGVLPPAVALRPRSPRQPAPAGSARLLYVGRFVPQKGVSELLHAVLAARQGGAHPFRLRLVGTRRYSDPAYVARLKTMIAAEALGEAVDFVGELTDSALAEEYARADAVVLPSFHEGFCVPVIEALAAGCYVIASDAGNLPALVGDLGSIVATGDIAGLAAALADFAARAFIAPAERTYGTAKGPLPVTEFIAAAGRYAADFSYDNFRAQFLTEIEALLAMPAPGPGKGTVREPPFTDGSRSLAGRLDRLRVAFAARRALSLAMQNLIETGTMAPAWLASLARRESDGERQSDVE